MERTVTKEEYTSLSFKIRIISLDAHHSKLWSCLVYWPSLIGTVKVRVTVKIHPVTWDRNHIDLNFWHIKKPISQMEVARNLLLFRNWTNLLTMAELPKLKKNAENRQVGSFLTTHHHRKLKANSFYSLSYGFAADIEET